MDGPLDIGGTRPGEDAVLRQGGAEEQSAARFISKGSAHFNLETAGETRDFHFLLLPKMTMLAFSAAVEPLRIANQLTSRCLYRWYLHTEDGQPVRCSNGIPIVPDGPLDPVMPGATIFVCSGVDGYLAASARALSWLRHQVRHGARAGGICTGAFTLARAGLLAGRRFTLHWENQAAFGECFPDLSISDELYCRDGSITTCGGGNACLDMMVGLIAEHYGPGLAARVLEMCLNTGHRAGSSHQRLSTAAEIGLRHPVMVRVLNEMKERFAEPLEITDVADRHGVSRRQLERLFQSRLGVSPARKLREIRLARANSLLAETDLTITEIAAACGFPSADAFRKTYRKTFRHAPSSRFGALSAAGAERS